MAHSETSVADDDRRLWQWLDVPEPSDLSVRTGETLQNTWLTNHTENRRIARGGRLYLTDERIVFRPHGFDARLGADSLAVELDEVRLATTELGSGLAGVVTSPLDTLFGGGVRTRLRVQTDDGAELFVVDDPGAVARTIEAVLAAYRLERD
jgi:hypothetical protein